MQRRDDEFGRSGGKAAERLREQLKREFGEVPEKSPSEPAEPEKQEPEDDGEARRGDARSG